MYDVYDALQINSVIFWDSHLVYIHYKNRNARNISLTDKTLLFEEVARKIFKGIRQTPENMTSKYSINKRSHEYWYIDVIFMGCINIILLWHISKYANKNWISKLILKILKKYISPHFHSFKLLQILLNIYIFKNSSGNPFIIIINPLLWSMLFQEEIPYSDFYENLLNAFPENYQTKLWKLLE